MRMGDSPFDSGGNHDEMTIPTAALNHFLSHPWTRSLFLNPSSSTITQPTAIAGDSHDKNNKSNQKEGTEGTSSSYYYIPIPSNGRIFKPATGADGFFSRTLATDTTVPHFLTLVPRQRSSLNDVPRDNSSIMAGLPQRPPSLEDDDRNRDASHATPTTTLINREKQEEKERKRLLRPPARPPDAIILVSLATPGICGYANTAHGGLIASLFDEALWSALMDHPSSSSFSLPAHYAPAAGAGSGTAGIAHTHNSNPEKMIYTAQLNIRYKQPIAVPGTLIIRSWNIARDGRKHWAMAQALQEVEPPELEKENERRDGGDGEEEGGDDSNPSKRKRPVVAVRAEALSLWIESLPML